MPTSANQSCTWAVYVYLAANVEQTDVRDAAVESLRQMAAVGSGTVSVAAQLHLAGRLAFRYVLPPRPPGSNLGTLTPRYTIPNCNSADPDTIVDFFRWAKDACPAERVLLVVWGHGYGLDDYFPEQYGPHRGLLPSNSMGHAGSAGSATAAVSEGAVSATEQAVAVAPVRWRQFGKMQMVNVVGDMFSREVMSNTQMAAAVSRCNSLGPNVSVLALDACNMAMAEVWSEFAGLASIGIASEAHEPDASFPYDRILARMHLQPNADEEAVARMIVDAYVESYSYDPQAFVTLSACSLDAGVMKQFHLRVQALATLLTGAVSDPGIRSAVFRAADSSPSFDSDGFVDLGRFCDILGLVVADPNIGQAARDVVQALPDFVRYARYSPLEPALRISQTTGVAVWFPPWLEEPSVEYLGKGLALEYLIFGYGKTEFAKNTGWGEFLWALWSTCSSPSAGIGPGPSIHSE